MHARFSFKDFVALALLLAIGLGVWLAFVQQDRVWARLAEIRERLVTMDEHLARLDAALGFPRAETPPASNDRGHRTAPGAGARAAAATDDAPPAPDDEPEAPRPGGADGGAAPPPRAGAAAQDRRWARPGIPVAEHPRRTFSSDPRSQRGFQPDGEFVEIFESEPAKITPFVGYDVFARRVFDLVLEPLGEFDPKTLAPRGVLAAAWQIDPAFRWLRVRLRDDAQFSDGVPVTAEDVRWTFEEFVLNPEIPAQNTRSTLDMIEKVRVIDPKTVEFVFKEAVFTNLTYTMGVYILPKHFYSRYSPAEISASTGLLLGSGPFKLDRADPARQWVPGEEIVLVRNERHDGEKPVLSRIRFKAIPNDLARLTAYRSGDGDMINPAAAQFHSEPKMPGWAARNLVLNWVNMRSMFAFIGWNCGLRNGAPTPFEDARVRRAMTLALDRERILRDVWEGLGRVSTGPGPAESLGIDPAIKAWPYDLEQARALLEEAGWVDRTGDGTLTNADGTPFRFQFLLPEGSVTGARVADYLVSQCRKLGIACEPVSAEWAVVTANTKSRDYDAVFMGWQFNTPESDPKQSYHSASIPAEGSNFMQWSHPEADALIDRGRRELDPAKRQAIWRKLHALIHEEQPQTFVIDVPWRRFVKREIGNVHPYPTGLVPWEYFRASGPLPTSP